MNKRTKWYLSIIAISLLLLVSCGSRRIPEDEVDNNVNKKSLTDVFFNQQSDSEKQYLNNISKKYESKINVSEFEFILEEAITESNTGYCFYKVNIKSNSIPVSKMAAFNDLYQLTDGRYWIQVAAGASPDACPDYCEFDIKHRVNVLSDNEVEVFLCCKNQFESNDIDIQVLKEDENVNTGYGMQTDGKTAKSAYDFELIVNVDNIKSLQIDDNIYEISEVKID